MSLDTLLIFQVANGVVWGLILALVALGLSLIYGILNIINIAHASLYMLGAVFAWALIEKLGNFWLALVVAPLVVGFVSLILGRFVLRPIAGNFALSILATTGILMIIQDSTLALFGGDVSRIEAPIGGSIPFFGIRYPTYRIFVAGFSIAAILAVWALLKYTRYGAWIRAVKQDSKMAMAVGIPMSTVYMMTIVFGGIIAGLAGVLAAPIVAVEYQMGLKVLAVAFMIVVIGGVGSLPGSAAVAVLFGVLEGIGATFLPATEAKIATLLVLSAIIIWRPEGLFRSAKGY